MFPVKLNYFNVKGIRRTMPTITKGEPTDIQLTVFNVADVTNDDVADRNLNDFATAQCRKLVLVLNLALQTAELSLLAPVIERSHQHNNDNGDEDSNTFYPASLILTLIMTSCQQLCTKRTDKQARQASLFFPKYNIRSDCQKGHRPIKIATWVTNNYY